MIRHAWFFQAEDGIRDSVASRGLGDVYKRQLSACTLDEHVLVWHEYKPLDLAALLTQFLKYVMESLGTTKQTLPIMAA